MIQDNPPRENKPTPRKSNHVCWTTPKRVKDTTPLTINNSGGAKNTNIEKVNGSVKTKKITERGSKTR